MSCEATSSQYHMASIGLGTPTKMIEDHAANLNALCNITGSSSSSELGSWGSDDTETTSVVVTSLFSVS